ncbi:MAG: Ig-like domain-containing protein, partial [Gammaproteobacteria bacterium]
MKVFKKIGLVFLGGAMVLGIGFSLNSTGILETQAVDETYDYVTGDGTWVTENSERTYSTTNFTMTHKKNASSSNIATTYAELRVYASHSMEIVPKVPGTKYITAVEVTASESKYATAMGAAAVTAGTSSGTATSVTGISTSGGSVASFNLIGVANCEFVKFTLAAQSRTLTWKISYANAGDPTVAVTGVTLTPESVSVQATRTANLTATIAPSNATNKGLSWSSNNEGVATVSGGVVTGVSAGNAVITVTTADGGFQDTTAVTVTAAPTIEHAGTLADPYSVSDAVLRAEQTGTTATTDSYYIKGFISLVKSVET